MQNSNHKPRALCRATTASTRELRVKQKAGVFGGGIIENVSVCTAGEALGHDVWLDGEFLQDVAVAINSKKRGVKCRFGHSMFGGGLGTAIGRVMHARVTGEQVRGDLHLLRTKSIKGNLGEYVMSLAEEDPELFGTSIVFDRHGPREAQYAKANRTSPDARNTGNLQHARLDRLWSCDVVDEPAANPGGLFTAPARPSCAVASQARPAGVEVHAGESFLMAAKRIAASTGGKLATAASAVAKEHPDLYAKHVQQIRDVADLRSERKRLQAEAVYLKARIAQKARH